MSAGVVGGRRPRNGGAAAGGRRATIVAGLGRMGSILLRETVATGLFDVVALVDINPEAGRRAAGLLPPPPLYPSLREALDAVAADCCIIATPSNRHGDDVATALAAGLDVFCEKPLTLDGDGSRRLGRMAADVGLRLQVGFWRRYSTPFRMLRAAVHSDLGEIVSIRAVQWDADPPPPSFCDPAVSGGLIVDCGIHEFDLAGWLGCRPLGDPVVIAGPVVDANVAAVGDVDNVTIVSPASGGATLTVDLSLNCRYADDVRTEVLGTRGAAFLETVPTWSLTTRLAGGVFRRVVQGPGEPDALVSGVRNELAAFAFRSPDEGTPGADTSADALERCLEATRLLRATPVAG